MTSLLPPPSRRTSWRPIEDRRRPVIPKGGASIPVDRRRSTSEPKGRMDRPAPPPRLPCALHNDGAPWMTFQAMQSLPDIHDHWTGPREGCFSTSRCRKGIACLGCGGSSARRYRPPGDARKVSGVICHAGRRYKGRYTSPMAMPMKRKRLGDDWGDHAPLDLASTNLGKKFQSSAPRPSRPDSPPCSSQDKPKRLE